MSNIKRIITLDYLAIPLVSLICAYISKNIIDIHLRGMPMPVSGYFLCFYGKYPEFLDVKFDLTHFWFLILPLIFTFYLCSRYQQIQIVELGSYTMIRHKSYNRWVLTHMSRQQIIIALSFLLFNIGMLLMFCTLSVKFDNIISEELISILPMLTHHLIAMFIVSIIQLRIIIKKRILMAIIVALLLVSFWSYFSLVSYDVIIESSQIIIIGVALLICAVLSLLLRRHRHD